MEGPTIYHSLSINSGKCKKRLERVILYYSRTNLSLLLRGSGFCHRCILLQYPPHHHHHQLVPFLSGRFFVPSSDLYDIPFFTPPCLPFHLVTAAEYDATMGVKSLDGTNKFMAACFFQISMVIGTQGLSHQRLI